jgi:hypothetical protein
MCYRRQEQVPDAEPLFWTFMIENTRLRLCRERSRDGGVGRRSRAAAVGSPALLGLGECPTGSIPPVVHRRMILKSCDNHLNLRPSTSPIFAAQEHFSFLQPVQSKGERPGLVECWR